jgi:UDP-3-O-[3-hydroxymyristoyl] glucosamine N-acyltransferase
VFAAVEPARVLLSAIALLHPAPPLVSGVSSSAVVDVDAVIGAGVFVGDNAVIGKATIGAGSRIGALCFVGDGVVVGAGCVLSPGAIVLHGVTLGERVLIGPGSVVGDDGFVFAPAGTQNLPVRHAAAVVIGDDVELGANVCVDRGLLRDTRIGARTKIDNLAQVAHDVVIGADVVIIAQVGIAGFATIGDQVALAGQAGVNPHVRVAPRVRVGGQAGVVNDVDVDGAVVSGTPAFAHHDWLKSMARFKTLDALEKRVRRIERTLSPQETKK